MRFKPYVPACRLFMLDRAGFLDCLAATVKHPGIAADLREEADSLVEALGLFTTEHSMRPEILVKINRAYKLPTIIVLGATSASTQGGVVVHERQRVEWAKWCGHRDGVPGTMHGDHAADYDRWRERGLIEDFDPER